MKVKTVSKNLGISPIKAKVVCDVVKGMNAAYASGMLEYINKGASIYVKKAIDTAIADAKHNFNLNGEDLVISEIRVDKGPQAKLNTRRGFTLGKGGYAMFNRKYAHITVVLDDKSGKPVKKVKQEKEVANKVEESVVEKKKVAKKKVVKSVKNKEGK